MLGAAIFYKSTPKMPKNSQLKRGSTTTVSPVSKKRRVRQNAGVFKLMERNDRLKSKDHEDWTPRVVITKLPSGGTSSVLTSCKLSVLSAENRGTETIGSDEGPGKKVVRSIKSENGLEPRRTSARLGSSRLQSAVKQEKVAIKEEVKEEEEDEEWVLPGNKMSDDNEDSDDSDGEMSAYEKKRLQNIQENAKFFASLGISKTKNTLSEYASSKGKSTITKGLKREKKEKEPLPRRPLSLRIRRMDPEGVALPDAPAPIYADDAPSYVRKPSGPFDMEPTNLGSDDGGENSASRLFKSVTNMSQSPKSPKKEPSLPDLAAFTKTLQRMRLAPERIAKVTKDRVLSVAVHPSASKIITCAGDKWGRVGVWDVESAEGDDGVYLFEPHSRPVSCLQFAPKSPAKLFSCSYDGTLRCGDFEKGIFDEIHTTDVDDDVFLNHFDFLSPDGMKLLVAQNQQKGYVQVVDARVRSHTSSLGFWLHNRYVKTVHIHPTKPQYFVTASNDSSVALWDLRSLKEHGHCKSISSVPHGKSVSAAYFSPITGSKAVTTSYDDRVRILDVTESGNMEVEKAIRHDNHTGRWLTTFRAGWHPRREDVIVVGSMERPRRIHLFDDQGRLIHSLMDEALGSVCSVNAFHPTRDLIVGANSSGRLHVFM